MTYRDYQELFRGCVLYLPLNGNSKDYFSNKVVTDVETPTYTDLGNNRTAYTTSTTSQYSTLSQSDDFSFGSDPFTIFGWFYPTSYAGNKNSVYRKTIGLSTYNGGYTGWELYIQATSDISDFNTIIFGNGIDDIIVETINIAPNSGWYNYAITKAETSIALYLNNIQVATGSNTTMYDATGNVQLGGISVWDASYATWNFIGYQKSIIILKGYALSQSEINELYILTHPNTSQQELYPVIYGLRSIK